MTAGRSVTPRRHAVVLAVAASLVLASSACSSGEMIESTEAPGYEGQEIEVDRSPFELAGPTQRLSVTTVPVEPTLPGGRPPLPDGYPEPVTPTTEPTTTTTTTTTTTLPDNIVVAAPQTIFSLCGFSLTLVSLRLVVSTPGVDLPQLTSDIRQAFTRYELVAPPEQRASVDVVNSGIELILTSLERSGFDINSPETRDLIDRANRKVPPFERFEAAASEVREFEDATCPRQ